MQFLKNISIRNRIIFGFSVPIVLLICFSAWLGISIRQVDAQLNQVKNESIVYTLHAKEMEKNVVDVQQFLSDISATRGQDGLNDGFEQAEKKYRSFNHLLQKFYEYHKSKGHEAKLATLEKISASFEHYYAVGKKMAQAYIDGGPASGNKLMPQFDESSETLQTNLRPFIQAEIALMHANIQVSSEKLAAMKTVAIVITAVVLAVAVLVAMTTTRSITRPINEALHVAQAVAAGDLTSQIEADSKDEMGQLKLALKNMNAGLLHLVRQIREGANTITSASTQLSADSHALANRTEEQASSLEETASSMEELTSTINQNASNTLQANQLATTASDNAEKSGEMVKQIVESMETLSDSSKKIVEITSVIDSIAFQTNILALNAAVEAARAGEQGRGFAVVASEVRSLAQRCTTAAREIKTLIDDSVQKIEAGHQLVGHAGASMENVFTSIHRVHDIMNEISSATSEQSDGINQINQAIIQMDQLTQQNAVLVEGAATTAESLNMQAKALLDITHQFKTDRTSQKTPPTGISGEQAASQEHLLLALD